MTNRGSLLGPHLRVNQHDENLDPAIKESQCRVLVCVGDENDFGWLESMLLEMPSTIAVFRMVALEQTLWNARDKIAAILATTDQDAMSKADAQAQQIAQWHVDQIKQWVDRLPKTLSRVYWQGQNEADHVGAAHALIEKYRIRFGIKAGLKIAYGCSSVGNPPIPPFDAVDGYAQFDQVWLEHKRHDSASAIWIFHEYETKGLPLWKCGISGPLTDPLTYGCTLLRYRAAVRLHPIAADIPKILGETPFDEPGYRFAGISPEKFFESVKNIDWVYALDPSLIGIGLYTADRDTDEKGQDEGYRWTDRPHPFDDVMGYVKANKPNPFLWPAWGILPPAPLPPAPTPTPIKWVVNVAPDTVLRLRALPNGDIIGKLGRGTEVELVETSGVWFNIKIGLGIAGWVSSLWLKPVL